MLIDYGHQTQDISEAADAIGRIYRKVRFRSTAGPFQYRQQVQGDDRVAIGRFSVTSPTDLTIDVEGIFAVGICSGGNYQATSNGVPLDVRQPFLLEPGAARSVSDHHRLTIVNLTLPALASFGGDDTGGRALRVGSAAPVSREMGRHWTKAVEHTLGVFSTPELLDNVLIRRACTDLLFATATAAFGIESVDARPSLHDGLSLPSAVRRAMRYMDDNAHKPIGVEEISEAARMSVRGLQGAFRRAAGITPLEYLRTVRLAQAHHDLLSADPRTTTVTDIAHRWGFSNVTRFSNLYRGTYAESPRDALTR
jgi:AraC-like DNA-binding protein